MKVGKIYNVNHKEYMVLDGTSDMMPGQAGLELLANRSLGVGADCVMIFTGTEQEPSFRLYDADGMAVIASREAYVVLAKYLRDCQFTPNVSEMVRYLGEHALAAGMEAGISSEVRITECFWQQALHLDRCRKEKEIA